MSNSQWNDDQGIGGRAMRKWEKEREAARLREGEECHVARPGEGTYECRHDNLCAACRLRSAEARANRTSYTVGETEWAMRIANAEERFVDEYNRRKAACRVIDELEEQALTHKERLEQCEHERDQERTVFEQAMAEAQTNVMELRAQLAELKARITTLEAAP